MGRTGAATADPKCKDTGVNIALFSGELSGDLIGGSLAQELKRQCPEATLWGLGSDTMREAGVELLADSASWGAIGLVAALSKAPGLLYDIYPRVKRALSERRPDVVTLIDFGAFNVRVARYAKKIGLKVCYYFPPGSWRRTGTHGAELARITDALALPFPWAAERYRALGANAVLVGHPLLDRVHARMSREEFAAQFGMEPAHPIIGLLPGSRRHEVMHLMPTLIQAARRIYENVPDAQFVVGVAPTISAEMMAGYLSGEGDLLDRLNDIWHEFAQEAETKILRPVARTASRLKPTMHPSLVTSTGVLMPVEALQEQLKARRRAEHQRARTERTPPPTVLIKGLTYEVMAHSDVLLICSGTATLEAAIFGTPMVILYRGSKVMELEYHLRGIHKKVPVIGLPNILAGHSILPELIQRDATPEAIARCALPMLNDMTIRHRIKQDLAEVRALLGEPGASVRTARLILDMV
jgi:lipid-A-disaccharide synthase